MDLTGFSSFNFSTRCEADEDAQRFFDEMEQKSEKIDETIICHTPHEIQAKTSQLRERLNLVLPELNVVGEESVKQFQEATIEFASLKEQIDAIATENDRLSKEVAKKTKKVEKIKIKQERLEQISSLRQSNNEGYQRVFAALTNRTELARKLRPKSSDAA